MSSVYIISNHGKLTGENGVLKLYYEDNNTIRTLFPHNTDNILIAGKVTITAKAMDILMWHKINTVFISGKNGKYNGKLEFLPNKNIFLRKKQYLLADNPEFALPIAKSIVLAKVKNQLTYAQRIKRKSNLDENEFTGNINFIKDILNEIEKAAAINELRGLEGMCAKEYFSVMRHNILPDWAEFPSRSMNPPRSNVNAVLSFVYTLLMYRVESAIELASLDAMAGFLHSCEYGKNSLVFDLMEEFRTPIADALTCSLFNLNQLCKDDFAVSEDEEQAVLLTEEGLKKVITEFENKINSIIFYAPQNDKFSLNKIIIEQVQHFRRVILGEESEYRGFAFK
ncbi:CRISPR-associated protein Cas1 [Fibrobacteria bacterium R8-3-H12]